MTALRRTLSAIWLSLAITGLLLVGLSHLAPAAGYRLVIVGGPSMSPAIPIGAVVVERAPITDSIQVGDVVTVGALNGTSVTHRVTRLAESGGLPYIEIKGDANVAPDPVLVPVSSVTGVVAASVPFAGYAIAFLSRPTGVLAVLGLLVALLIGIWALDDIEASREAARARDRNVPDGHPA